MPACSALPADTHHERVGTVVFDGAEPAHEAAPGAEAIDRRVAVGAEALSHAVARRVLRAQRRP